MATLTIEHTEIDTCETLTMILTDDELGEVHRFLLDRFGAGSILVTVSPLDPDDTAADEIDTCEVCGVPFMDHGPIPEGSRCDV